MRTCERAWETRVAHWRGAVILWMPYSKAFKKWWRESPKAGKARWRFTPEQKRIEAGRQRNPHHGSQSGPGQGDSPGLRGGRRERDALRPRWRATRTNVQ